MLVIRGCVRSAANTARATGSYRFVRLQGHTERIARLWWSVRNRHNRVWPTRTGRYRRLSGSIVAFVLFILNYTI